MRATALWLLLLALSVAVSLAQEDDIESAELEAIATKEPETSEVDKVATQALSAQLRYKGWRIHKNKKCSYNYYKAAYCPKDYKHYSHHTTPPPPHSPPPAYPSPSLNVENPKDEYAKDPKYWKWYSEEYKDKYEDGPAQEIEHEDIKKK